MDFEDILEDIGKFGRYQVRVFLLVNLFETPASWMMFLPVFIQKRPEWSCSGHSTSDLLSSTPSNCGQNYSIDSTTGVIPSEALTSGCMSNNGTNQRIGLDQEVLQYCDSKGRYCDGGQNVTFFSDRTTAVSDLAFCGREGLLSAITPLQMSGVLLGACLFGQLADTFGRRTVLYSAYSLMLLAGLATALAPSPHAYIIARFFVGAFFGGTMVVNFVLPLEFVSAKWRTFCGCIGFWAVGHILLAPLAYAIHDWRYLSATCCALGAPLLLTWPWVPESPRWLLQRGRIREAFRIVEAIADCNGGVAPDPEKLERLASHDANRKREHSKYSYWDLFRNCNMTKNTLIVVYMWFVGSAVYYGTSFNAKSLTGNPYLNFFMLGLAEIPAVIFVVIVNNRIGRKKTVSILMLIAGFSCFVIVVLYILGKEDEKKTLIFSLLGKFGISGAWAAAQVFSAELFPTVVRNIGVGACSMAARLGGIVAPVIVELANAPHRAATLSPLPFAVFGCLAFACGVLSFFLPETLNRPLPESLPQRRGCCRGLQEQQPSERGDDEEMAARYREALVGLAPQPPQDQRQPAPVRMGALNGSACPVPSGEGADGGSAIWSTEAGAVRCDRGEGQ